MIFHCLDVSFFKIFYIHSLMEEHLCGFQVLAIMNKAAINIARRFLCGPKFSTP